jgi:hypothetical protein
MAIIIDRRKAANRDRTSENRGRLLRRYKGAIKEQLPKILGDRKLLDSIKGGGGKVTVPKRDLSEPQFTYGEGGMKDTVLPGNKDWVEYDTVPKPESGESGGAGDGPDGMDEFSIVLSRDEFLNMLFEDCELPFMLETLLAKQTETVHENAGFQVAGSPNRLSVIRSYKNSKARRLSSGAMIGAELKELEEEFNRLTAEMVDNDLPLDHPTSKRVFELRDQIAELLRRKTVLPLFDSSDLRFRTRIEKKVPKTHATMFMLMDNSGSMGEREKTIARKFFILLYLFLDRNYDQIDLRFISHTTEAEELPEDEFFNTHKNGGTIVSSALDLLIKCIESLRGKTNIYVAQVSDGDNTGTDNGTCSELLIDDILPYVNYFAYVQVEQEGAQNSSPSYYSRNSLWSTYSALSDAHPNHASKQVYHERDIFGVFHAFFSTTKT